MPVPKVIDFGVAKATTGQQLTDLTIYTDRCCPQKRVYVLTWSTWTMFSAGPCPNFLQRRAGSIIKVSESSDGYEARVGEYYNYCCDSPGHNAVILLA